MARQSEGVMASLQQRTEVRDGMRIDFDVPITMDDGVVLRADVFRPLNEGKFPVILSYGPYAKNLAFQDGYPSAWQRMTEKHPDVTAGSSNLYQSWEVVDPEKWVPHNYACVRVDSRGAGCSPGHPSPDSSTRKTPLQPEGGCRAALASCAVFRHASSRAESSGQACGSRLSRARASACNMPTSTVSLPCLRNLASNRARRVNSCSAAARNGLRSTMPMS